MTTVCFLNADLSILFGPVDMFLSLVWKESYTEDGTFTLQLPFTKELFAAAREAVYLSVSDREGLGRVEKIRIRTTGDSGSDRGGSGGRDAGTVNAVYPAGFTVSGRLAESLLSERVISRGTRVRGELLASIASVLADNACAGAGARAIPHLVCGASEMLYDAAGNSYQIDDAPGGRTLSDWLRASLAAAEASYRILPDYDAGMLIFCVYRGLDRTQTQKKNTPCVFSTSFSSIGALEYISDTEEYRNFAYIAGEGEGDARVTVTLDLRTDINEPLRELYVDARDLRSDDGGETMSAESYQNLLLSRGRERLLAHRRILQMEGEATAAPMTGLHEECGTDPWDSLPPIGYTAAQPFRVGRDFSLGDLCDIASEALGMVWSERITSVVYTYEGNSCTSTAHFGCAYPDLRTYIKQCTAASV